MTHREREYPEFRGKAIGGEKGSTEGRRGEGREGSEKDHSLAVFFQRGSCRGDADHPVSRSRVGAADSGLYIWSCSFPWRKHRWWTWSLLFCSGSGMLRTLRERIFQPPGPRATSTLAMTLT